jgi:hypothetical protein
MDKNHPVEKMLRNDTAKHVKEVRKVLLGASWYGSAPLDETADEKRSCEGLRWILIWLCVAFVLVCAFSYVMKQVELKGCMECEVKK